MEQERTAENLSSIKLKPCPFCGKEPAFGYSRQEIGSGASIEAYIFCKHCGTYQQPLIGMEYDNMIVFTGRDGKPLMSVGENGIKAAAACYWNRRADDAES